MGAPLDIGLVRKLGAPTQPELGIGALGEGGEAVLDQAMRPQARASRVTSSARSSRMSKRSSSDAARPTVRSTAQIDVDGRVVLLVDDGLVTGVTAAAAARCFALAAPRAVILAVPVCPSGVAEQLRSEFDGFVCLSSPRPFLGVGAAYEDFAETSDREVLELLARARRECRTATAAEGEARRVSR